MHSFDWPQTGIVDVDLINHRLRILTKVHGRINMKAFAFEFPYANFALKPVVINQRAANRDHQCRYRNSEGQSLMARHLL